jgi:raffinose/stachyose/melibiose transport system substrate-binding protein
MNRMLSLVLALLVAGASLAIAGGQKEAAPAAQSSGDTGVVEIKSQAAGQEELEGEVVISIDSSDLQTYQAIADAYMKRNPKVKVLVELKASGSNVDAYNQWIRTQFAAGTPRASILESAQMRDLIDAGKIVNLATYLGKTSRYTGKKWEESFEPWALNLVRDTSTGEMYLLPYQSTQTFWVYNKRLFKEAGITDVPKQPTWSQFAEWCEKLRKAGSIAIAQEGTTDRMWGGGKMPWVMRSAMDQYHREDINLVRSQPGDWSYNQKIDAKWKYDPADPRNDDPDRVTINVVRHLIALRDKQIRFDTPAMAEMMDQVARVYRTKNGYVPPGWNGVKDAYPLFLTQRAAMIQQTGSFFITFPRDIKRLAEGGYYKPAKEGEAAQAPSAEEKAASVFEYGVFAFPTIEGKYVQGKARANELTQGYLCVPVKDRKQNDVEVDFLMYWTSPEGIGVYLQNKLDVNNLQGGIGGPAIVKGATLPPEWERVFSNTTFIGNYEKAGAPGDKVARGFYLYEPTKREWALLVQRFFNDEITALEFGKAYQKLLEDNWGDLLKFLNMTPEDLAHPEKRPPGWKGAGPY